MYIVTTTNLEPVYNTLRVFEHITDFKRGHSTALSSTSITFRLGVSDPPSLKSLKSLQFLKLLKFETELILVIVFGNGITVAWFISNVGRLLRV
jgi:hypothetical protein